MKLALPTIADTPDPGVETRAVYVEEWVESLAYANPPRLLEQLLANLEALNRQPLRASQRVQLLDLHLKPYLFALDFRRQQNPAMTGSALDRQRALSRALRQCAIAAGLGYKQALSETSQRQGRFNSSRELRTLLQRSMLFTTLALLCCYDAYRPTLRGLWSELIALYKFAARQDVADKDVSAPVDDELFSRSSAHLFKRMCLSSLVDPYHLAYGELWRVFGAFGDLVDECAITRIGEVPRPAGFFLIDPTRDRAPSPLGRSDSTPSKRCRLLDANNALARLERQHKSDNSIGGLPSHLLAAMIRALGLPPRRHTPREASEGRVNVSVGLSATHHFLNGGEASGSSTAAEAVLDSGEIHISDHSEQLDFTASYGVESWHIVNEGPSGLGISRSNRPQLPVGVGDLVGLRFPLRGDAEDDWTVAVVRWLNVEGPNNHQAGLQILSATATPVMVYRDGPEDTVTRIATPALALPALNSERAATIAVSRGLFAAGSIVRATGTHQKALLTLGTRSESTGSFDLFSFTINDES